MKLPIKKQKVLYVITKSNKGGAQRHVYDLATSLPRDKFDVIVVAGGNDWLIQETSKSGIRNISINSLGRDINPFKDFLSFFHLIKIFKKEHPDIIHLHSSKIGGIGALAGRLTGVKKIIFTGHGWTFNEERSFIEKWAIRFLHWLTMVFSHKTIAVSKPVYDQVSGWPFVKNKLAIIHNGIKEFSFKEKSLARTILTGDKAENLNKYTWIGTISELHKNKGLEYTIEAITLLKKSIPQIIFVVMGEGEERKNLEKLIQKNNLENIVFLVGHKNNASTLLKALDIFTLTSTTEAFPYAILEAGLAELPVIASNVGGIPDIIESERSGFLVKPKNPQEIASAIEHIIKNQGETKAIGEKLHRKIITDFSINKMLEEISEIYK